MRDRIAAEYPPGDCFELKYARGGLVDLEFIAQYLQLLHAHDRPEVLAGGTAACFEALAAAGLLDEEEARFLAGAARMQRALQGLARLTWNQETPVRDAPGPLLRKLAAALECKSFEELEARLRAARRGPSSYTRSGSAGRRGRGRTTGPGGGPRPLRPTTFLPPAEIGEFFRESRFVRQQGEGGLEGGLDLAGRRTQPVQRPCQVARRPGSASVRGVHLTNPLSNPRASMSRRRLTVSPRSTPHPPGVPGQPHLGLGELVEGAGVGEGLLSGLLEVPVRRLRVMEATGQNRRHRWHPGRRRHRQAVEQAPGILLPPAGQECDAPVARRDRGHGADIEVVLLDAGNRTRIADHLDTVRVEIDLGGFHDIRTVGPVIDGVDESLAQRDLRIADPAPDLAAVALLLQMGLGETFEVAKT